MGPERPKANGPQRAQGPNVGLRHWGPRQWWPLACGTEAWLGPGLRVKLCTFFSDYIPTKHVLFGIQSEKMYDTDIQPGLSPESPPRPWILNKKKRKLLFRIHSLGGTGVCLDFREHSRPGLGQTLESKSKKSEKFGIEFRF